MPWNTIERYGHMLKPPAVKVGDTVKPGQTIGVRGSTGYSTGPHSHYERRDAQGRVMDSSAELGVHRGDVVRAGELLHPASSATADSTSSGVGHN